MKLAVTVPKGYMHGAYYIEAKLEGKEIPAYRAWPVSFDIPKLPMRLIHTKPEYLVGASTEHGVQLNGIFNDGIWVSHIYTNGVEENKNPTSIEAVEVALKSSIEHAVSSSLSAYSIAQQFLEKNA